jgi:predicted  nucleic acid-binding Zn-ribbon protein
MFINGDNSDDVSAVISNGRGSCATPSVRRRSLPPLPEELTKTVGSLCTTVACLEERADKTDSRISEVATHFVSLLNELKKGKVTDIDQALNELTFTVAELSDSCVNQEKTINTMNTNIQDLNKRVSQAENNFQNTLGEISRLTDDFNVQRALHQEIRDKQELDSRQLKGDLKVVKRAVNDIGESVSTFQQNITSCTTSITYLRKKICNLENVLIGNDNQANFSEVVSGSVRPESVDFSEHETSSSDSEQETGRRQNVEAYVELSTMLNSSHISGSRRRTEKNPVIINPRTQQFVSSQQQPPVHVPVNTSRARPADRPTQGEPIPVIASRIRRPSIEEESALHGEQTQVRKSMTFYNNSQQNFYVGNISEHIRPEQIVVYMRNKNVACTSIKMLPSKVERKISAQITVNNGDIRKILNNEFWPNGVYARRWYNRPSLQRNGVQSSRTTNF